MIKHYHKVFNFVPFKCINSLEKVHLAVHTKKEKHFPGQGYFD